MCLVKWTYEEFTCSLHVQIAEMKVKWRGLFCSVWSVIIFESCFPLLFTPKSPIGFNLSPLSWRFFLMGNFQSCQSWLNCSIKTQIFDHLIIVAMNTVLGFPPSVLFPSCFHYSVVFQLDMKFSLMNSDLISLILWWCLQSWSLTWFPIS